MEQPVIQIDRLNEADQIAGSNNGKKNPIASYWRGEEPLWKAIWVIGIILFISGFLSSKFINSISSDKYSVLFLILFYISTAITGFWWSIVLWRCSKNAARPIWMILARIYAVLLFITTAKDIPEFIKAITRSF